MAYFLAIETVAGSGNAVGFVKWIPLGAFAFDVEFGEVSNLSITVADSALNYFLGSVTGGGPSPFPDMSIVRTNDEDPTKVEYRLDLEKAVVTRLSESSSAGHVVEIDFYAISVETFSPNNFGTFNSNGSFGWSNVISFQTTVENAAPGNALTGGGGTVWFMKVDGMSGGSTVQGREGWFALDEFELNLSKFGSSTQFDPVQAYFKSNQALTALFQSISSGNPIVGVQIDGVTYDEQNNEHIDQSIILKNVLLTELAHSGAGGIGASPQTRLAMDYEVLFVDTYTTTGTTAAGTFKVDRNPDVGNGVDDSRPTITAGTGADVTGGNKYFLAATTLEGNSTDPTHAKWFDVNNFGFTMSRPTELLTNAAGIGYSAPVQISNLELDIEDDSFASQTLSILGNKSTLTGATLQATGLVNGVEKTVFQLDLGLVTVNTLADGSGAGVGATLDFRRIEVETVAYDANGVRLTTNRSGWDTINNVTTSVGQSKVGDEFSIPTGELDYYMIMSNVTGESTTQGFEQWMEISDLSFAAFARNSIGLPPGSTPPAELSEISLTVHGNAGLFKFLDLASRGVMSNALRIEGLKAGVTPETAFILRAGDIFVANVQQVGTTAGGAPTYNLSLHVREIEINHVNPDNGQVKTGSWNAANNTATVTIDNVSGPGGAPSNTTGGGDEFFFAINGVRGTSNVPGSVGWFEVLQYSFGVALPVDLNGTTGVSIHSGLQIVLDFTPAMSTWLKALATGQTFSGATLKSIMSGNNQIGSFIDMAGLKLVSYTTGGDETGSTIALLFSYNQIEHNFNKLDVSNGNPIPGLFDRSGYNVATAANLPSDIPGGLPGNGANALPTTAPNFMLINGFNGGVVDPLRGGWFKIESFSMGATREGNTNANFGTITVEISSNLGLVDAMRTHLLGQDVNGVVFDGVNIGTNKLLSQIAIGNAMIESINEVELDGGSSGYAITFSSYELIKVTHFNASGVAVLPYGWNLEANTVFTGNIEASPGGTAQADVLTGTSGEDVIFGLAGNDVISGGGGNDILAGGANDDRIDGGTGNDTVSYADATGPITISFSVSRAQNTGGAGTDTLRNLENIIGSGFGDSLTGNAAPNVLEGGDGTDTLSGLGGSDTLIGGLGIDTLIGGADGDQFVLIKLAGNNDTIQDFQVGIDDIVISASLFGGGLVAGNLNASQFLSGNNGGLASNGGTTDTRFIYNSSNGQLSFDSDGTNSAPGTVIATLTGAPAITTSDFLLLA